MRARLDATQVRQCDDQPDGPVSAHAEVAHVVKEDDSGGARRVAGLAQQSADHHVGTTRFVHHGRTESVVPVAKNLQLVGNAAAAQLGSAVDDQARRLAAGVGVDD